MLKGHDGAPLPAAARTVRAWQQPGFGHQLRKLRTERGLSQKDLVGDGMSAGYLSRLERGERPPTERAVRYLAGRLGVSPDEFEKTPSAADTRSLAQVLAAAASASGADTAQLTADLRDALGTDEPHNPELRWQALWLLARYAGDEGDRDEQLAHLRELVSLSDELSAPQLRVRARTQLAKCLRSTGQLHPCLDYAGEAFRIACDHGLPAHEQASALMVLVSAEAESGRITEAAAHAVALQTMADRTTGTLPAEARWTCAMVSVRQGDHDAALKLIEGALADMDAHDSLLLWLRLRLAAGSLYLQATPPRTALAAECLREAGRAVSLVGTEQHEQELLSLEARLAFGEGRLDDCRFLCRQLEGQDLRLGFRDRMRLEVVRCRLAVLDGDFEGGTSRLRELAEQAGQALNVDLAADIWRTLAEILASRSDKN
ncbi:helix-turn-helix domain-containing protein [Streptomyces sp. NEAU-sy36]|uniref:helix-turn-helix domain-containing protein n=1 Tax=unclassified Streptomyces TaxID=2593676 RepID=UPI0015D5771F|nr:MULTISPECIES: helix-turn-helix domain-containing protein [unclassified Streptomyces]QLJ00586.1 helix-turn-helix domain-containing protein [Streptomyces sp. NEAU-sy36]